MIADALLHDERVVAVRGKFMNASDEEVSDVDGCLSRSMTIKAVNTIMTERIWIDWAASGDCVSAYVPRHQRPVAR